jgi:hypothetical protein
MSSQNGHDAHGNTVAAWTLTIVVLIGSCIAGVALPLASQVIFWVGIAVCAVGCILGGVLRMAGHGNAVKSS